MEMYKSYWQKKTSFFFWTKKENFYSLKNIYIQVGETKFNYFSNAKTVYAIMLIWV